MQNVLGVARADPPDARVRACTAKPCSTHMNGVRRLVNSRLSWATALIPAQGNRKIIETRRSFPGKALHTLITRYPA